MRSEGREKSGRAERGEEDSESRGERNRGRDRVKGEREREETVGEES